MTSGASQANPANFIPVQLVSNGAFVGPLGTTANFTPFQGSVAATSSPLVAARAFRASVTIVNSSGVALYLGNTGVTTTTGVIINPGYSVTLNTTTAIYAVVATGTQTISGYELY